MTLTGGSQINGNSSIEGGGGIFNAYGSVTLTGGSQIKGNKPDNSAAVPGCSGLPRTRQEGGRGANCYA